MQVFSTDTKLFWSNELKSWLWIFAFTGLLFLSLKYFLSFTNDRIIFLAVVVLLLKLSDTLTQYHVREIKIDEQKKQLIVIFHSSLSGEKIKKYNINKVTSEIIKNSGIKSYLFSHFALKIFLEPKNTLVINSRYGFTLDALLSVDKELRSILKKV